MSSISGSNKSTKGEMKKDRKREKHICPPKFKKHTGQTKLDLMPFFVKQKLGI